MSKLILNANTSEPLDISNWINQKVDLAEEPNYVNGPNIGGSKKGTKIFDRIHTSYSFSVPLIPIPRSVFYSIIKACEANTMYVIYDGALGDNVLIEAQVSLSGWKYALDKGERIYHGCVITVEGV